MSLPYQAIASTVLSSSARNHVSMEKKLKLNWTYELLNIKWHMYEWENTLRIPNCKHEHWAHYSIRTHTHTHHMKMLYEQTLIAVSF